MCQRGGWSPQREVASQGTGSEDPGGLADSSRVLHVSPFRGGGPASRGPGCWGRALQSGFITAVPSGKCLLPKNRGFKAKKPKFLRNGCATKFVIFTSPPPLKVLAFSALDLQGQEASNTATRAWLPQTLWSPPYELPV